VKFNSTSATFNVVSDSSITATVPQGATTGPISVTNPAGTATSSSIFTVMGNPGGNIGAPIISGFSPTSGPVGTVVTITGTNFTGATAVKFGSTSAIFNVISDTSITATVPAGAKTGKISVTNSSGTRTSRGVFKVLLR
jgi:large repetitive protein